MDTYIKKLEVILSDLVGKHVLLEDTVDGDKRYKIEDFTGLKKMNVVGLEGEGKRILPIREGFKSFKKCLEQDNELCVLKNLALKLYQKRKEFENDRNLTKKNWKMFQNPCLL